MKLCRYCNKSYPESAFGVALTTPFKVYRRHKCRDCYRAAKYKLQVSYRDFINNYKKDFGCRDCGNRDYRVLEFHHSGEDKEFNISDRAFKHIGSVRLEKEIKKCILLCANCHRILHYLKRQEAHLSKRSVVQR